MDCGKLPFSAGARALRPRLASAFAAAALAAIVTLVPGCATGPRPPPAHELEGLRADALRALPPEETGDFLDDDLVEPARLDHSIRLDVRYATSDNFLRWPVYPEARVLLQRPAAEADGYRPWYVTQLFWLATTPEQRDFVADPAQGSKHNRGCAVDLTLYDLATGLAVRMPSGYDEFSPRAHPDYTGGPEPPRAARDLLRRAMEAEGFIVDEREWWHYDCRDWQRYRIGNVPFKDLR